MYATCVISAIHKQKYTEVCAHIHNLAIPWAMGAGNTAANATTAIVASQNRKTKLPNKLVEQN